MATHNQLDLLRQQQAGRNRVVLADANVAAPDPPLIQARPRIVLQAP